MDIPPFRTEFHGRRQTDRQTHDETICRFRNSANALKIIMNIEKLTTFMEVIL